MRQGDDAAAEGGPCSVGEVGSRFGLYGSLPLPVADVTLMMRLLCLEERRRPGTDKGGLLTGVRTRGNSVKFTGEDRARGAVKFTGEW